MPASPLYSKWEKDILATEELVLEALCFDMGVEQPWVILRRSIRGMDDMWAEEKPGESSKQALERIEAEEGEVVDLKGKGKQRIGKVSEATVAELGWAILSEA